MITKKEMIERSKGTEDMTRAHTGKLESDIKDLTAQRTNVNLSPKDKRDIKELMQTTNLSEGIRALLRDVKRTRGL